jgi:hypothetical protein
MPLDSDLQSRCRPSLVQCKCAPCRTVFPLQTDLWYLTVNDEVQLDHLLPAICQKLEFREKHCEGQQAAFARKEARLRALWNTRRSYQVAALPPFEQFFREMRGTFRRADLP